MNGEIGVVWAIVGIAIVGTLLEGVQLAADLVERIPGRRITAYAVALVAAFGLSYHEIHDYHELGTNTEKYVRVQTAYDGLLDAYVRINEPGGLEKARHAQDVHNAAVEEEYGDNRR
jgi:hypothetical protein